MISQSAIDQFLNFYNFLILFLFDEMFSVELESNKPDVKWWGKKGNDLFFKKVSFYGNIIIIWKIKRL